MSDTPLLIAGLGNPGTQYARNRHNAGFMAVDTIHESYDFGPWRAKYQGIVAEGKLARRKVYLLKPMTYMNDSGFSLGAAARFLKLPPSAVVVIHDEIDLAACKLKAKTGGGDAGHNGLRSITAALGPDYHRVRIGVGHPEKGRVVGALEIDPRFQVDRLASAILEFAAGHAIFTCSTQLAPHQNVELLGTRGRIGMDTPWSMPNDRPSRLVVEDIARPGHADEVTFAACDQWGIECDRFAEAIVAGKPAPIPIADAVANMRVIDAIFRSAKSGRWEYPEHRS